MRILLVDDDRFFSDPLVWRLLYAGHDVVYCQCVDEVLDGWDELVESSVQEHDGTWPPALSNTLNALAGLRLKTREEWQSKLATVLSPELLLGNQDAILQCVRRMQPFQPPPDLLILDLMMPTQARYFSEQTEEGWETGVPLLRDILKRLPHMPVVVITVRVDSAVHARMRHEFGPSIREMLTKPVTPAEILERLEGIALAR